MGSSSRGLSVIRETCSRDAQEEADQQGSCSFSLPCVKHLLARDFAENNVLKPETEAEAIAVGVREHDEAALT